MLLLHSLLKLRIALEQDWDGEPRSRTWQGRSRVTALPANLPPHGELLPPSSEMFPMSSQGVGGGAGFTEAHPGLPRCGSDLPGEGCASVSARRLWDRAGFRVWHPFCGSCAEAWGSCRGRVPQLAGSRMWNRCSPGPALCSPWPS